MAENWRNPDLLGQRVDLGAVKARATDLAHRAASQSRLRFTARREALLLVAVILFLLFVFGDLKLAAALMAGQVAVAAAAVAPGADASNSRGLTAGGSAEHPSTMGAPKTDGWRALVDAMPDAAIALRPRMGPSCISMGYFAISSPGACPASRSAMSPAIRS